MYTLEAFIPSVGSVKYEVEFHPYGPEDEFCDPEIINIKINDVEVSPFEFLVKLLEKNAKDQWDAKYKDWYKGELLDMYRIMYGEPRK